MVFEPNRKYGGMSIESFFARVANRLELNKLFALTRPSLQDPSNGVSYPDAFAISGCASHTRDVQSCTLSSTRDSSPASSDDFPVGWPDTPGLSSSFPSARGSSWHAGTPYRHNIAGPLHEGSE